MDRSVAQNATLPTPSIGYIGGNTLARLLATATAKLEDDCVTAKLCIQRAAALLGIDLHRMSVELEQQSYAKGGLANWQAQIVQAFIQENLSLNIHITDLARMIKLSKSHFRRAFRTSFGEPPRAYILRQRVLFGQKLLVNSQYPLARIALEVGMADQAHFSRSFRRLIGISPSAWRRECALRIRSETERTHDHRSRSYL